MISFYDAHNHLQDERLAAVATERTARACVVNGTSEKDWPLVQALAKKFDWVFPAFGLHPWFTRERSLKWFDCLRRFVEETPRASVGEIGLDRWMRDPDIADQEEVFAQQLELAAERNVAASIHCLKAWGALEEMLKANRRPARGFLLHSFGGSAETMRSMAKLGAFFSISGYFAHERKSAQRAVFQAVPLDRLLVETDAPDMLPPPELIAGACGEVNHPANIEKICGFAAELRGMPLAEFAPRIEANFQKLFA